jgi:hypothetical protein
VFVPIRGPTTTASDRVRHLLFKWLAQIFTQGCFLFEPLKVQEGHRVATTHTYQQDSLAHLRNPVVTARDFAVSNLIPRLLHRARDDGKRLAPIVTQQRRNILEQQVLGLVMVHQLHDLEEQDTARVLKPKVLTRIGEGLAGKASTTDVKRRDCRWIDGVQVAQWLDPVIGGVALASRGVNVASHHTLHALGGKRVVKASNSTAEVNKPEGWHWGYVVVGWTFPF